MKARGPEAQTRVSQPAEGSHLIPSITDINKTMQEEGENSLENK